MAAGVVLPAVGDRGLDFDRGLYRVAAERDALLLPAALSSSTFVVTLSADPVAAVEAGEADLALVGGQVHASETDKGRSAIAALRQATKDLTFRTMLREDDAAAAFPVRVEVIYAAQAARPRGGYAHEFTPTDFESDGAGPTRPSGSTGTGAGGGGERLPTEAATNSFSFLPPERSVATPESLAPPFPFRSLILAYVFLIPLNFVVQIYAGSMIAERLGRKGEALLASTARPWEIVVGKALPYFLLMMGVGAGIALWIGGGWLSLVALAPLALAFLGFEFVAAMFARSFRELTFLTVFASVLLTIYAFLPAVFTSVHPVALVSPISLVVMDLRGEAVTLGEILYATLPLSLVSLVLFLLGAALYREEDLFHQKRILHKALDALARQVKGIWSGFRLSVLLIPCVLVAELLLIAFLFAWPAPVGMLGVLLAVALVEETAKGLPAYAAVKSGALPAKRAVLFGALAGLGFFVAEKGFLLASLVGLFDVPAAGAVFGPLGGGFGLGLPWWAVTGLLLAPLTLHVVTAAVSAHGAAKGKSHFLASFALAIVIHTAYNYLLVNMSGGLIP